MKKIITWYYGKASIRKKLVISYLLMVALPLAVLGVYSHHMARENLLAQTRDTIESNVASVAYSLETNIQRENDNLKYLSYNTGFREKLEKGRQNATALARELNNSVEPIFWYFIASDRNIKSIEIYSPCISQAMGSFLKTEEECLEEAWYEYHQTVFQPLWTWENGKLYVTRTVLDEATSSCPIGIMKLDLYPNRLMEPLYQSSFRENGVLLTDAQGQVIGGRSLADETLEAAIREQAAEITEEGIYETAEYILGAELSMENGWRLFYYVDKKEIAGDMQRLLNTTLLIVGVCLLVILVLIGIISRILSSRILRLKQCAEKVGRGEFDVTVEEGYTDEIGVVARSMGVMSRKINEMMGQMYQMGLEKRATELKALQAMLNPHFLYNCLSSIKWKAIRAEQEDIADITGLLAKFYRTTLNEGRQITTVGNELENVKAYLEIQRRTHEAEFDMEYRISQEGLELEMPNFLLQPIVENAVCHGIDYCQEDQRGLIRVEYRMEGDFLLFHIYNNGPRMEEEQIQKILTEPGKGYGIYNIQERIKMYYDGECGIFTGVTEEGLICFTVRIRREIVHPIGEKNT